MKVNYVRTLERPENAVDRGNLRVNVIDRTTNRPIMNATVDISYTGQPDSVIEELSTDDIKVSAPGYEDLLISGSEIFSGENSVQQASMAERREDEAPRIIVIPANTLFGNFPPKIPENEIQPVNESGEIVLSRVVVPEIVVVHDGVPTYSTAADYYVRYSDYIKNVASSEIYSTWPRQTIEANVLAIMSFTLNRVYTCLLYTSPSPRDCS